jgi:Protein of unknown function (DUF3307)
VIDDQTKLVLLTLLAFQAKHLVCDFVLQSKFQVTNKGYYGHRGGLIHAGWHVLFTIPVLLILTRSPSIIGLVVLAEFVVHYHTDWLKARTERVRGWSEGETIYWLAFGADQFIHQVTYIIIVAAVLRAGA